MRLLIVALKFVALTAIFLFIMLCGAIYCFQDYLVFPGVQIPKSRGTYRLLPGVSSLKIATVDGETLQAFTTINPNQTSPYVGLIFHGNGESAETQNFLPFFKNVGIQALTFDYRGYGDSTGWPSEEGIYRDAEAAAEKLKELSGLPYSKFVVLGNSLGSGPAAYIAQKIQPRALVLIAGYSDFLKVVKEQPFYGYFSFLLKPRFPTSTFVGSLTDQCVVIAHGQRDELIPFSHLVGVIDALPKSVKSVPLPSATAGHDDIFYKVEHELIKAVQGCLVSDP